MASLLKRLQGRATIAGTVVHTVPPLTTLTLVGVRVANNDNSASHWFHLDINGYVVTGIETPLPIGSALDAVQGSKIILEAGDVITAYSDTDNQIDIHLSFLEQS